MEALRMENITKSFGSVLANNNINFIVNEGEVHTLLGENGAGKSTLMNILIGLYQPSKGSIYIRGKKEKIDSPSRAVAIGIGMVHQHFMLVEAMTVFENIILGTRKDKSIFINKDKIRTEILELENKYDLNVDLDKQINEISVGEQQRVEIIKALYRGADILILDEPTAVLTETEVKGLFKIIKKLTKENKAIIFISHKMKEVLEISDKITILRQGETVITVDKDKTNSEELASLMIGKELIKSEYKKFEEINEYIMMIKNVDYNRESKHNGLSNISLSIGRGEIVGVAGVDGNGQSQLAQLATGIIKPDKGEVFINSKKVLKFSPEKFIKLNVSHVPEDRNSMGIVGAMSVKENLILKSIEKSNFSFYKGKLLKKKNILQYANEIKEKYDIRCGSLEEEARNLSGGNQQKIILAREIEENPELLVAVHPTRGLDIGATKFVHDKIIGLRDNGCGVLLISADLDEILTLSDRILVMFEGKVIGEFSGKDPNIEEIALSIAGRNNAINKEMYI